MGWAYRVGQHVSDQRKPQSVYAHGDEPDPRFSLANERTALAWMRTALALVAAGIAIISISSLGVVPRWTALIGAASYLGGALLAWRAVAGWARVERAQRAKGHRFHRGLWPRSPVGSSFSLP
jgi:putative membrane protein